MVTDDQLHGIKRMRASGHTHQEIADRLNLKRSTVAYQLKKLKDRPEDSSIEMIYASNFTPKETLSGNLIFVTFISFIRKLLTFSTPSVPLAHSIPA